MANYHAHMRISIVTGLNTISAEGAHGKGCSLECGEKAGRGFILVGVEVPRLPPKPETSGSVYSCSLGVTDNYPPDPFCSSRGTENVVIPPEPTFPRLLCSEGAQRWEKTVHENSLSLS